MKQKLFLFLITAAMLVSSCVSNAPPASTAAPESAAAPGPTVPPPENQTGFSARAVSLSESAVFEVVLEKPINDNLVYERELNWEKIPFAIRTDKYVPIGTAFAISDTELVTAFHVINLGQVSMTYGKYFIRDSKGNVYEVDRITSGSNEQDFLTFTVKGRSFTDFFEFETNYKTGDPVYSIGNALGEGIVVRNGLVLGTVPEEESGRWNLLKSSADGNPGNSGGPLVSPNGKVIALVSALRQNILYSVPAELIINRNQKTLSYRIKPTYGHFILANNLNRTFESTVNLPDNYRTLQEKITDAYKKDYALGMETLFKEAPEYLTGPNNYYMLQASLSSSFPEIDFVDQDDDQWTLSKLNTKAYNLVDDGRLLHADLRSWGLYKINKPKSVSLEKIYSDPRYCMDLILQNIRQDRTLAGTDKYRILSYGDPIDVSSYTDTLGRKWISARWLITYEDRIFIMYILPLPNGPALITTSQSSYLRYAYEWDIQKFCDHLWAAYTASFENWDEFINLKSSNLKLQLPPFLENINFKWRQNDAAISFTAGSVSFDIGKTVFDWNNASELFLAPSHYMENDSLNFSVRKIILNRDPRGREFITMYKNIKPDPRLGTNAEENWQDIVQEKFPFNERPAISAQDNKGFLGTVIKPPSASPEVRYSLYLSMEDPRSEDDLSRRLESLKQGVQVEN
ncbi:serine protease [Spirochaetia bacterium]|nr:serine protease [Spirochaetia bacterium]